MIIGVRFYKAAVFSNIGYCPFSLFAGRGRKIDPIRSRHFYGVDIDTGHIDRFKNVLMF